MNEHACDGYCIKCLAAAAQEHYRAVIFPAEQELMRKMWLQQVGVPMAVTKVLGLLAVAEAERIVSGGPH